jgi:uncharacterized protein (DUF2249 family)
MTPISPSQTPAANTVGLDVRGLAPPEPMLRVLESLAGLPAQAALVVQIHREPVFLYDMIAADGWGHTSRQLGPDHWEVRLRRREDEG